jgi:DNA-binding LytR/AlgR family response regulator
VTDCPPPSALREIRHHLRQPLVLAGLAGTTLILAISGPFRTLDLMARLPRLAYWAAVVFGTYAIGTSVVTCLHVRTRYARLQPFARVALGALALGTAVWVALVALDTATGLGDATALRALAEQLGIAIIVSGVVLTLREVALADAQADATATPRAPAILDRLPLDGHGALLALSAEDHDVRVVTRTGETLVLMRLADAMRETGDVPGLQVHRSHWVARNAVRAVWRSGEGALLTLVTGRELPASRRFIPALRQAGLLPGHPRGPDQREGTALAGMDHD